MQCQLAGLRVRCLGVKHIFNRRERVRAFSISLSYLKPLLNMVIDNEIKGRLALITGASGG
jgi:hypothetical protein